MTIWIIIGTIIVVGVLAWFLSPSNIAVTSIGKTEFTNEGATEFIYSRFQKVSPSANKEAVRFVVEKEWEWQYANAPKTDSNLTLVERSDKRLLNHLIEESTKVGYNLNEEEVKLILEYLEDYEDSLVK